MNIRKHALTVLAPFVCLVFLSAGAAYSEPNQESCEALKAYIENNLTDEAFGKPVTNVEATWDETDGSCEVTGWIWPETQFKVILPTDWNERYINNGGGGWDGRPLGNPQAPMTSPDGRKYAISLANGGYMERNWPSECASFGLKEPFFSDYYHDELDQYPTGDGGWYGDANPIGEGNPYACQKVFDYGIRHLRETPLVAQKIIRHYYGSDPLYTYYYGQSNGGKEGQISAQKLYDIYDGFWINSSFGGMMVGTLRGMWNTVKGLDLAQSAGGRDTVYSKYKAALHYKTVYDKCDGVDGLVDGLIDDPRACEFDALIDLPACTAEQEADGTGTTSTECFTLAQRQALKEIYDGPHDSNGNPWYVGTPVGSEYVAGGRANFGNGISDGRAPCMFANIAMDPPEGPYFDMISFDWDIGPLAVQETTCEQCYDDGICETFNVHDVLDAITMSDKPVPNMGGFEPLYAKGGKIIQQHGWGDALVSPLAAGSNFYEQVMKIMGVERTKSFYKLYLIPGGGHSRGGLGCWPNTETVFQALVDWVENDIEPAALIGERGPDVDENYPDARTRPICAYPEVARYSGEGSIEDTANFMCVPPIQIRIEPETLNLKSKGVFTARITLPEGYSFREWKIGDLSCEGAPAVKVRRTRRAYLASFDRKDLVGVLPGEAVELTVKGTFTHDGQQALIQASDNIRVISCRHCQKECNKSCGHKKHQSCDK